MYITIADMQVGDRGQVAGFYPGDRAYRQQLLAMGLTRDTPFTVLRRAPLGDPVEIQVRDCFLSLRQAEASLLKIIRLEGVHGA